MIVGLDMGGTHIDGVIIEDGKIINKIKNPTNRDDLFQTIWTALQKLLKGYDKKKISRINLSTTVSTNAIVEGKTSPVGMIIQSGPGLNHDFLSCGDENIFISGYIDHRGKVVKDLNIAEIQNLKMKFKEKNIDSCAIVTKFSTRNPSHELRVKEILEQDFSTITMGHTLSGKLNFPRRVYTSYLNSAVYYTFNEFAANIKKSLESQGIDAPLFILKADGGTMTIKSAQEKPVETILSGPAASFMGINAMLPIKDDAILLDIGGTTTDIFFLADGVPLFEPLGIKIDKYNTLVRAIYSVSIGLGGDSKIDIHGKDIKIGPERKGPPIAFGGITPTPTDAMVTLGMINGKDNERSYEAMKNLGNILGLSPEAFSKRVLETMVDMIKDKIDRLLIEINSQPVYTIKEVLYGKKLEPKSINIIGGPAKILSSILEDKFGLSTYYPDNYQISNAVGAALAKPTMEINMIADTQMKTLNIPELGLYENIDKNYNLERAKNKAIEIIKKAAMDMGTKEDEVEAEIMEESSFNMVNGFYTSGKNIRIKAQIKPGLIYNLRSEKFES